MCECHTVPGLSNLYTNIQTPEFEWDEETQGQVLGAMFWGYVAMNVPSGLMADRFGGKRVLFTGILLCSLSCLLIPLAARKGGPIAVIVARVFEGVGEVSSNQLFLLGVFSNTT